MADNNSIPGLSVPTTPPAGIINAATTTPPVTGAPTPAQQVQASPAATVAPQAIPANYTPQPYQVTPEQTVSGQIKNIIASGSPLMQQAEAHARNLMNQRGLINSSMAVGAAQGAVIGAATPIATADAGTYAKAASDTTTSQNAALAANALATNAASTTNAQISASTNLAEIQSSTSQEIARLQSDTTLTAQDKQNEGQQIIAAIQANTTLTAQEKQNLSNQVIAQLQASTTLQVTASQGDVQKYIADLQANTNLSLQQKQDETAKIIAGIQSNTQLSVQDKAVAGQSALAAINNAAAKELAKIQADASLSIADKQTASAKVIAGMNNQNAIAVQTMVNEAKLADLQNALAIQDKVNAGNLAAIQANGVINKEITDLTNANKLLLQTSTAASAIYQQVLVNMGVIMTNKDLNNDQKTVALNNSIAGLNDALTAISNIANNTSIGSTLDFTSGDGAGTTLDPNATGGDGEFTPPNNVVPTPTMPIVRPGSQILQTLPPDPPATPAPPTPRPTEADINTTIGQFMTTLQQNGGNVEAFVKSPAAAPTLAKVITQISTTNDADYLQVLLDYQRENFASQGPNVQAEWIKQSGAAAERLRQMGVTS